MAGSLGIAVATRPGMTDGEKLLRLIEEMVELKVDLRAGVPGGTRPDLVEFVARKRHDDQTRLRFVREQIVALLNG